MKLMKRGLLLLCVLGFAVGVVGCEQSDMAPDDYETPEGTE